MKNIVIGFVTTKIFKCCASDFLRHIKEWWPSVNHHESNEWKLMETRYSIMHARAIFFFSSISNHSSLWVFYFLTILLHSVLFLTILRQFCIPNSYRSSHVILPPVVRRKNLHSFLRRCQLNSAFLRSCSRPSTRVQSVQ